jgi:hypothetical protein
MQKIKTPNNLFSFIAKNPGLAEMKFLNLSLCLARNIIRGLSGTV